MKNGKREKKEPKKPAGTVGTMRRWAKRHGAHTVIVLAVTDGKTVDWEGFDFESSETNWAEKLRVASDGAKKFALAEAASGDLGDQVIAETQKLGDAIVDSAFRKLGSIFGGRPG